MGQNHFDVLPEGWIQVTHNSGMPLYLQKNTRVCTLSKPYFLGSGSVRVNTNTFTKVNQDPSIMSFFRNIKYL